MWNPLVCAMEAWERFRRKRRNRHKRFDYIIVAKKKKSGNGPELIKKDKTILPHGRVGVK